MDHPAFLFTDRAGFVDGIAENVHDATQGGLADRHLDAFAGVVGNEAALESVGGAQCDGAHHAVTELLLHLEGDSHAVDAECVEDLRHRIARKFDVDNGADDLYDFALVHWMELHGSVQILRNGNWESGVGNGEIRSKARGFVDSLFSIPHSRLNHTAAAPPTISEISWVIAAWRALL